MTPRELENSNLWSPIRLDPNISKIAGDAIYEKKQSPIARLSDVRQYMVGYPGDSMASCYSGVGLTSESFAV